MEGTLLAHGIRGEVRPVPAPLSLALGLAESTYLESAELPSHPLLVSRVLFLGLWAATSVAFFLTLASFLLGWFEAFRTLLLLGTLALGAGALVWTVYLARQGRLEGGEGFLYAPWCLLFVPELALVALALVLFLFLGAFLLLVLWLPLLFLALNVLSLGELWRHYRTVWVHVLDGDPPRPGPRGRISCERAAWSRRAGIAIFAPRRNAMPRSCGQPTSACTGACSPSRY